MCLITKIVKISNCTVFSILAPYFLKTALLSANQNWEIILMYIIIKIILYNNNNVMNYFVEKNIYIVTWQKNNNWLFFKMLGRRWRLKRDINFNI